MIMLRYVFGEQLPVSWASDGCVAPFGIVLTKALSATSDATTIDAALNISQGSVSSYAEVMNDQWNIAGGKFSDGYPSITSHYGYHMTVWHVLLALNGQDADLSDLEVNGTATLSFNPKIACSATGFEMPFLLPGVFRQDARSVTKIVCTRSWWVVMIIV